MAGDWIKMRVDLLEDPAVFKIRNAIGDDRLTIIGRLHTFWAWADKHAVDGYVDGATSQLVDEVSGKEGFANAMVSAKWLSISPAGILLPNSDRHNGESAKERSLKSQRQARWRAGKDAKATTKPSTPPSTREEKKREEKEHPPGFTRFWDVWPKSDRKEAKGKCLESWLKGGAEAHADRIIAHVERLKASAGWTKNGGEFIPAPLVYLNQRKWEGAESGPAALGAIV
jgi:hypothetical protein